MGHGGTTLFLAQLAANKVVPRRTSSATGTGAFVVDFNRKTLTYDLTFHGLEHGAPKSIGLYNFGEGGRGALVFSICSGEGRRRCPNSASGNLTGTWDSEGRARLDGKLLSELASARIYVEIVGGDGRPEIRAQLEPNGAMVPVRNYTAHLAPMAGVESQGAGTAVFSEVHFPDGRVMVFYQVTVAGTRGSPRTVDMVAATTGRTARRVLSRNTLPKQRLLPSRAAATGGTMTGDYEVNRNQGDALFATRMLAEDSREIGLAVGTSQFPQGELFGVLKPVN